MKTAKLIIGIISIILFIIIIFQSCAAGIVTAIDGIEDDVSGSAGMLLAFAMLIAGIVGLATRKSKGGGITAGAFYVVAAIIGFTNLGVFGDLIVWSIISLIFGIVFIVGSVTMKSEKKVSATEQS